MPKRRFENDQPGGYDPIADISRQFEVEPLRLRPSAEIGLEGGNPGGPSTPRPKQEMTADEIIDFLKDFTRSPPEPEPGYVYHTSPRDRALDIREEGSINTFDPSHGTDQESWPDASVEPRSYWGTSPGHTVPFSQDDPTLWRAKQDKRFKKERGTPDLFATEPVTGLEYLGEGGGWHPAGLKPEPSLSVPAAPVTRDDLARATGAPQDFVPDDPNQMSVYNGVQKDPEYWHKAGGGQKMTTPFSELTSTVLPSEGGIPPQRMLDPASLLGGVGIATLGDKTRNFGRLTEVNGIPLTKEQKLEGGYRFGDEFPGKAWASERVPLKKIYDKAGEISDDGKKKVFGIPVAQGATGGDASRMMTGPMLDLMRQAELSPEAKALLDQMMAAELTHAKTGKTRWPGIDEAMTNPEWHDTASMSDRALLAKMMTQKVHANERVPIAALRKALTAPDLLNRPALTTGMNVHELDLGQGLDFNPGKVHSSYPVQGAGTSLGRIGAMPFDWMFQTHAATRPPGEDLAQAQRTVQTQLPTQEFNDEWLDNIMRRIEGYGR